MYDTTHSQTGVFTSCMVIATKDVGTIAGYPLCILITFSVNIFLFILAVILVALYFRKGQVTLEEAMACFKTGKAILAARSDKEAQEMCRGLDEKVNFINALVAYKKLTKPRGKNKSGNVPKISQQYT